MPCKGDKPGANDDRAGPITVDHYDNRQVAEMLWRRRFASADILTVMANPL